MPNRYDAIRSSALNVNKRENLPCTARAATRPPTPSTCTRRPDRPRGAGPHSHHREPPRPEASTPRRPGKPTDGTRGPDKPPACPALGRTRRAPCPGVPGETWSDGHPPPRDQPSVPRDQPAMPRDQPAMPRGQPAMPRDQPAMPRGQPAMPRDQPAMPRGQPAMPCGQLPCGQSAGGAHLNLGFLLVSSPYGPPEGLPQISRVQPKFFVRNEQKILAAPVKSVVGFAGSCGDGTSKKPPQL